MANQIPFVPFLSDESVLDEAGIAILSRFTDLSKITIFDPIRNIESFPNILKNTDSIKES